MRLLFGTQFLGRRFGFDGWESQDPPGKAEEA